MAAVPAIAALSSSRTGTASPRKARTRRVSRTYAVVDKGEETPVDLLHRIIRETPDRLPILVINDEGHHCWRPAPGAQAGVRPDW